MSVSGIVERAFNVALTLTHPDTWSMPAMLVSCTKSWHADQN